MTTHASGSGTSWDILSPDVDRTIGQTYLDLIDIRVGVRKRLQKEHLTCGDTTAGGEHLPGGCNILHRQDSSSFLDSAHLTAADLDGKAGDSTGYHKGGLVCLTGWDGTSVTFWFYSDVTAATPIMITPASICKGCDWTWTGGHEFDGSVKFDGTATFTDGAEFSGAVFIDGTVDISGLIGVTGDMSINGNVDISGLVLIDGSVDISGAGVVDGTWNFNDVVDLSSVNITGASTYKTVDFSKQLITAWANCGSESGHIHASNGVSASTRTAVGDFSIQWTSNFTDGTSYAVVVTAKVGTYAPSPTFYDQTTGSTGVFFRSPANTACDTSGFCILAVGY